MKRNGARARTANSVAPRQSGAQVPIPPRSGAGAGVPVPVQPLLRLTDVEVDGGLALSRFARRGQRLWSASASLPPGVRVPLRMPDWPGNPLLVMATRRDGSTSYERDGEWELVAYPTGRVVWRARSLGLWARGLTEYLSHWAQRIEILVDAPKPVETALELWRVNRLDLSVDFAGPGLVPDMQHRIAGAADVSARFNGRKLTSLTVGTRRSRRSLSIQDKLSQLRRTRSVDAGVYLPTWARAGFEVASGLSVLRWEVRLHGADYEVDGEPLNLRRASGLLDKSARRLAWAKAVHDFRVLERPRRSGEKANRVPTDPLWRPVLDSFEHPFSPQLLRQDRTRRLVGQARLERCQDRLLRRAAEASVLTGRPTTDPGALSAIASEAIDAAAPRMPADLLARLQAKNSFVLTEEDSDD